MNRKPPTYEELHARVKQLQAEGRLATTLSRDEKIDWAYGNTVIENASITREMVESAYDMKMREPG
ncbi:MAG: hypothetical protein HY908_18345 [Myxococcales bacterium]|nr:hypothetical protein [Myxococcales bacterium]